MIHVPGLRSINAINLRLVADGLKPLSSISLDSDELQENHVNHTRLLTVPEIQRFREYLNRVPVLYVEESLEDYIVEHDEYPEIVYGRNYLNFAVARSQELLDEYTPITDPEGCGHLYGYPEDLVQKYHELCSQKIPPHHYHKKTLWSMRGELPFMVPPWVHYISFIPFLTDEGEYPEHAKEIGEQFRAHIRSIDSVFADSFEQERYEFLEQSTIDDQFRIYLLPE